MTGRLVYFWEVKLSEKGCGRANLPELELRLRGHVPRRVLPRARFGLFALRWIPCGSVSRRHCSGFVVVVGMGVCGPRLNASNAAYSAQLPNTFLPRLTTMTKVSGAPVKPQ